MKALVVQNSTIADSGIVGRILEEVHGFELTSVRADRADFQNLDHAQADLVVLLGSPHGVYDRHIPWIDAELSFAKRLLQEEKPVFGICFGGQMLAAAAGASVAPMQRRFHGWIANDKAVNATWAGPWFRWHGDRFDLPDGATLLASHGDIPQGFQLGHAVGVQFHPEVDEAIVTNWVSNSKARLLEQGVKPGSFLSDALDRCRAIRPLAEHLVRDVLDRCLR